MSARALPILIAAALFSLAACSPPMSSAPGAEDEIAAELGAPEQPLASGLYRVVGLSEPGGEMRPYAALLAEAAAHEPPESMPLPEFFVLQWHPPSQSYAGFMHVTRVYSGANGPGLIAFTNGDETYYLPFEVAGDGASASVFVYACTDIPEAYRAAQEIGTDCEVATGEAVRGALALLDPADMARLKIDFVSGLPDLGG